MGLPKIDIPTQIVQIPSSQKEITIRPFLVKEEKILLTALASGNTEDIIQATKQVVNNCVVTKNFNIEKLPVYDLEYLILQLRIMSIGDKIKVNFAPMQNTECEDCRKAREVEVDITKATVVFEKDRESKIQLTDDVGIVMRDPDARIMNTLAATPKNKVTELFKLVWSCVDCVYDASTQTSAKDVSEAEGVEFLESLNAQQFSKIEKFFETVPKLKLSIDVKCDKCGFNDVYTLEKLESFFG